MTPKFRSIAALGAVAALALPAVAEAKSHKVDLKSHGNVSGSNLSGTYDGKPVGHCTFKGKLLIPDTKMTLKCKGGTIKLTGHATQITDNTKGTWKITSGTGKYKGIKGSGTFTGKISTGNYHYVGKASY